MQLALKTLKGHAVRGKRVLVRVDFNVPIGEGEVVDDFRIRASIPTINYLRNEGARTILLSHLGRPEGKDSRYSLAPLKDILSVLLGDEVRFIDDCVGEKVYAATKDLPPGKVLLLENVRFYPGEEGNDDNFSRDLALLGDIYVNDAFGVSHRAHASIVGVVKHLPSFAGFLLEREVENLRTIMKSSHRPLVLIMGGAKVATKIRLISEFLPKSEHILLGGIIANTVLAAKGLSIGRSKLEEDVGDALTKIDLTNPKLHLPIDVVVSSEMKGIAPSEIIAPGSVKEEDIILDIGPESVKEFSAIIREAAMVVWNGPMGFVEVEKFAAGTQALVSSLCDSHAYRVVGGGDVIGILDKLHVLDKIEYVSTGGGAMLEFLAGDILPGIEVLRQN